VTSLRYLLHPVGTSGNFHSKIFGTTSSAGRSSDPREKRRCPNLKETWRSGSYFAGHLNNCDIIVVSADLESRLLKLEATEKEILAVGKRIIAAYGGRIYPFDLIAFAAIKRTLALIGGFAMLIRERNFICAAPLVRLHLDTALRLAAGSFVNDADELANFVLNGERLSDFQTADGKSMTDRELVKRLAGRNPWIERVYRATSGYIHLSRKHVSNAVRIGMPIDELQIALQKEDAVIADEDRIEACAAMEAITQLVLHCLDSWQLSKDNPPAWRDSIPR
jgi:hypothetical protein